MMSLASESVMRGSGLSVPAALVPLLGPGTGIRSSPFRPVPESSPVASGSRQAGVAPVAAAPVEVEHLMQVRKAAVVEIGRGERDVAELRRLERAVDDGPRHSTGVRVSFDRLARERQRIAVRVRAAGADVFGHRPHAEREEADVAQRVRAHRIARAIEQAVRPAYRLDRGERRIGRELGRLRAERQDVAEPAGAAARGGALLNRVRPCCAAALSSPRSNGLSSEIRVAS